MKLCRFGAGRIGIVADGAIHDVTPFALQAMRDLEDGRGDPLIRALPILQKGLRSLSPDSIVGQADAADYLCPVLSPTKVMVAGLNYRAHIAEMKARGPKEEGKPQRDYDKPSFFIKASSSLVGPSEGIVRRFTDRRTEHELELAVVIGRVGNRISAETALDHVAGYCIGLDVTLRGSEESSLRKSIDSYSVLGPWLTTADEVGQPGNLDMSLRVNGQLRQKTNTSDMLIDIAELIVFASGYFTLYPGDVIFTGTPSGVAPIAHGDELSAECIELGAMTVRVTDEAE